MLALYLVMRNDLPSLNPGKLAAQAAHVANVAVKRGDRKTVKAWERQTKQRFGTTIVLGATLQFIQAMMASAIVRDPTYPCEIPFEVGVYVIDTARLMTESVYLDRQNRRAFYLRDEVVGAWMFGDKPQALEGLELYP
jgi:Peptidyl-tRNA hydrolase PTH2